MKKSAFEDFGPISVEAFNKEKSEVYNVAVLGKKSLNNRVFTEQAMMESVKLLENAKVFLGHRKEIAPGKFSQAQDEKNYIGRLEGVYYEKDRVRAKKLRVINSEHKQFVFDLLENDPTSMGLSIDWVGTYEVKDGQEVITSFLGIRSADIVAFPATTKGFFESEQMKLEDLTIENFKKANPSFFESLCKEIVDSIKSSKEGNPIEDKKDSKDSKEYAELERKIEQLTLENKKLAVESKLASLGLKNVPQWAINSLISATEKEAEVIITDLKNMSRASLPNPPKKEGSEKLDESLAKAWL